VLLLSSIVGPHSVSPGSAIRLPSTTTIYGPLPLARLAIRRIISSQRPLILPSSTRDNAADSEGEDSGSNNDGHEDHPSLNKGAGRVELSVEVVRLGGGRVGGGRVGIGNVGIADVEEVFGSVEEFVHNGERVHSSFFR
jgi:hypothetical protein